jgi:hypothetical protein
MYKYNGHIHTTPIHPNLLHIPSTQRLIQRAKVKIPLLEIIPKPRRERHRLSTRPLHRKRRHKHQQFRTPTDRCSKDIIVLQEPFRVAYSDVELHVEADDEVDHYRGVDAEGEVA